VKHYVDKYVIDYSNYLTKNNFFIIYNLIYLFL